MKIEDMEKILEEKLDPEGATPSSSQESETYSLESLKMEEDLVKDTTDCNFTYLKARLTPEPEGDTDHVSIVPSNNIQMNHIPSKVINVEDVKIKPFKLDRSTHPQGSINNESEKKLQNRSMSEYIMSALQKKPHPPAKAVSFTAGSHFLENMVNLNIVNISHEHPDIIDAIEHDEVERVESKMKEKSIKLNLVLLAAIERDKVKVFEFLLLNVEDVKLISHNGKCLLHFAADHGAIRCCRYLLSKGLEPGVWDTKEESTPLPLLFQRNLNSEFFFHFFENVRFSHNAAQKSYSTEDFKN